MEGTFDEFEIPNTATFIGSYFLSNYAQSFNLIIPSSIITIKDRILYDSGCNQIIFEDGSQLRTLEDYAIYRIANLGDITFPKSVDTWGKYNLGSCGCGIVRFEAVSNLRSLGSYAFLEHSQSDEIIPAWSTSNTIWGTAVIKSCPQLNEVWIPNTVTSAIPATAIQDCPPT